MSERVVPTEPGVFYVKWGEDANTMARISIKGDYDAVARFFNGADVSVKNRNLMVLAPVPSSEAVAAAVEAMRNAVSSCPLGVAGRLEDAIAGLTGGEVG